LPPALIGDVDVVVGVARLHHLATDLSEGQEGAEEEQEVGPEQGDDDDSLAGALDQQPR